MDKQAAFFRFQYRQYAKAACQAAALKRRILIHVDAVKDLFKIIIIGYYELKKLFSGAAYKK